jgi:predicted nucleic acid-binding Zn ribbon protein
VIQKFSDPPVESCKECSKGPVRRLLSSPAIQFKGTGWYITDYAQKGKTDTSTAPAKSDTAKSDAATGDSTSSKGDAAKSDTSSASSTAKESKG